MDRYQESNHLFERAMQVTPCGIYGHMTPALTVPGSFPTFAQKAEGCRYWDIDGNVFIDYMCGYGPIILGYVHPVVEEAAARQRRDGNCFNHPTRLMVELAEKLVSLVDIADWAVFAKNGSDVTTWATQVAREFTGRKKVLKLQGGYHGTHAWCTPGHGGLIEEDRMHIHTFRWNDIEHFLAQIRHFRNQVAAVMITPFHHPTFASSEMPTHEFLRAIQATCRKEGVVLIVDDVRAGFRLHLGGSHRFFDFEPDIICFCKALGNGYPISAAVGRKELKLAASKVFLTGSYWGSAVPMAAALACLEAIEKENTIQHMHAMGKRLMQGLEVSAKKHGLQVECSGPPALPFMKFSNETNFYRSQRFSAECAQRGVFFHPHHNWFVCGAHQEKDIDESLEAADAAFQAVKAEFES